MNISDLRVMSFELMKILVMQLPAMFICQGGKGGELGNQAQYCYTCIHCLAQWIYCHQPRFVTNQNVQFWYFTSRNYTHEWLHTWRVIPYLLTTVHSTNHIVFFSQLDTGTGNSNLLILNSLLSWTQNHLPYMCPSVNVYWLFH